MNALFDLAGRRALVTGGASGLGRMIAEGLLRAGAHVTVTSRNPAAAEAAAGEMRALGEVRAIVADLSRPEAAASLAEAYRAQSGTLDILINNAGKTWGAPLDSFPDSAWAGVMAVNVQMPFKLIQLFLPDLERSGASRMPARVINIGSIAGAVVEPIEAYSYSASKAAIPHPTRQIAADLAPRGVTVNTIIPGFFPTRMTAHLRDGDGAELRELQQRIPLGRLGASDDIAGAVVFRASRAGSSVTGTDIVVDGGLAGCR